MECTKSFVVVMLLTISEKTALPNFPSGMKRLGMGLYSQKSQFEFVGPLSRARGEAQRLPVSAHLPVCKTSFYGSAERFHAAPLHKGHV